MREVKELPSLKLLLAFEQHQTLLTAQCMKKLLCVGSRVDAIDPRPTSSARAASSSPSCRSCKLTES